MTEDLSCPTCGSTDVPTAIRRASAEVESLVAPARAALMQAVEQLYLYGDARVSRADDGDSWQRATMKIVGHLSPRTEAAIDDLGADAVWRFLESKFDV